MHTKLFDLVALVEPKEEEQFDIDIDSYEDCNSNDMPFCCGSRFKFKRGLDEL